MTIEDKIRRITGMERADIKRINTFLNDVQEGLCEGDEPATMHMQLFVPEIYIGFSVFTVFWYCVYFVVGGLLSFLKVFSFLCCFRSILFGSIGRLEKYSNAGFPADTNRLTIAITSRYLLPRQISWTDPHDPNKRA